MKVLITGTAGFIGFHTVMRAVQEPWEIVGLDNLNHYYDPRLKYARLGKSGIEAAPLVYNDLIQSKAFSTYRFVQLDLEDRDNLEVLFEREQFDAVIALAAQAGVRYSLEAPHQFIQSNVTGFMNLLECCRKYPVRHLIYASTSSVYGLNGKMPFDPAHGANHPVSLYAASKKANEMMAHSYSHLFKIPSTGLRFFTVYGPWGRPDMALFKFANLMLQDKPIDVYNHGHMSRDFTYISDIVENVVRLVPFAPAPNPDWDTLDADPATSSAPFRLLNIGNSAPVSLMTYIEELERALGREAKKNFLPMQPGDVAATYADVSDLEEITGYRPQTSVREGVGRFVEWYMNYYANEKMGTTPAASADAFSSK